ncbi:MAG: hypothetical protein HUJ52_04325, partial [Malacoplasma sp.]|nr:hypothetical protein [Malacoplasma sp.]
MIENKVREQVLSKQDATHQIKIKKLPKKAKNKYYAFNCFLYVGKRKANHSDVKWYIVDKTDGVYTNISETGLLVLDVDGLREKNGSVTVVAKYKEKQYYHILNRWKDKKKNKALSLGFGLGLGLGLGIPALAGAITG